MSALPKAPSPSSASRRDPASRDEIAGYHLADETRLLGSLIERAVYTADERRAAARSPRGSSPPRAASAAATAASTPSCTSTACRPRRASS